MIKLVSVSPQREFTVEVDYYVPIKVVSSYWQRAYEFHYWLSYSANKRTVAECSVDIQTNELCSFKLVGISPENIDYDEPAPILNYSGMETIHGAPIVDIAELGEGYNTKRITAEWKLRDLGTILECLMNPSATIQTAVGTDNVLFGFDADGLLRMVRVCTTPSDKKIYDRGLKLKAESHNRGKHGK